MLGALQGAAVAFGGAATLNGERRFGRQAPRSGGGFTGGTAFGCFCVEQLRFGGGAAPGTKRQHLHLAHYAAVLAQGEHVAGLDVVRGFGGFARQQHAPQHDFIGSKSASFIKTRRPQPFIKALAQQRFSHVGWRKIQL